MKHFLFAAFAAVLVAAPAVAEVSPMTIPGATTVTVDDAAELFDEGVVFIDVRKASDYEAGRVLGAVNLDVKTEFSEELLSAEIGKDEKVVLYCNGQNCMRSSTATAMAVGWGFTGVHYMRDGFPAWDSAGLPIE